MKKIRYPTEQSASHDAKRNRKRLQREEDLAYERKRKDDDRKEQEKKEIKDISLTPVAHITEQTRSK